MIKFDRIIKEIQKDIAANFSRSNFHMNVDESVLSYISLYKHSSIAKDTAIKYLTKFMINSGYINNDRGLFKEEQS